MLIKISRYRDRLAKAIGCDEIKNLSDCDGIKDGIPYIIAIDCNVNRIIRALRQVERYDKKLIPRICCFSFQKSTIIRIIKKYHLTKTIVTPIPNAEMHKVFPEIGENELNRTGYMTNGGKCIEVCERKLGKTEIEDFEDREYQ